MIEEKQDIDTEQYSRQLFTFGKETMGKLMKMRVLIQGLRGIGIETAKNLCLAGPKSVTIADTTPCTMPDLGTNFFIREEHIANKVSRATASLPRLQELNNLVIVEQYDGAIDENFLQDFDVIVFTECLDEAY